MVEKDLEKIKSISEKRRDQNLKFRSWLKFHAPDDIDEIVAGLSKKYFGLIDCRECGNCCRSLEIEIKKQDLASMAKAKGETRKDFEDKFAHRDEYGEQMLKPPCPMLNGNLCSVYADRPETCRSFPHLEKPGFVSRLFGVIGSLATCPIAFNVFEELKGILGWKNYV